MEVELRKSLQDLQDPFCLYLLGIVLCDRYALFILLLLSIIARSQGQEALSGEFIADLNSFLLDRLCNKISCPRICFRIPTTRFTVSKDI